MKYAIAFSGGTESLGLVRLFRKYKPILLCFVHKGMESMEPLIRWFARSEGLEIHVIKDLSVEGYSDNFHLRPVNKTTWRVISYESPLLELAKQLGVDVLITGRKHTDFTVRQKLIAEGQRIRRPRRLVVDGVQLRFPFWRRE